MFAFYTTSLPRCVSKKSPLTPVKIKTGEWQGSRGGVVI